MNSDKSAIRIRQFDLWLADLNPRFGTEPGKVRPVVIIQTDMLNNEHPSTIICPVTTRITAHATLLRIALNRQQFKIPSAILVDQIRAIDNRRLLSRVGKLNRDQVLRLKHGIRTILDV
ncbi:MAG: type II toxin-antitoxin system PemK/MazF family toxin [Bacteroidota bacterium]